MSVLTWDQPGDRLYEVGIDRGVLYCPDGSAVPWSGLTEISEAFNDSTTPLYFDGVKYLDVPTYSDFAATLKAFTYPDEVLDLEGVATVSHGIRANNQNVQSFGLSYRTLISNDIAPDLGYKVHLLYGVTAIPSDNTFNSWTDQYSANEFSWDISGVPVPAPGFRATAHVYFDTTALDPASLTWLETQLYGSNAVTPRLPLIAELMAYLDPVTDIVEEYV